MPTELATLPIFAINIGFEAQYNLFQMVVQTFYVGVVVVGI